VLLLPALQQAANLEAGLAGLTVADGLGAGLPPLMLTLPPSPLLLVLVLVLMLRLHLCSCAAGGVGGGGVSSGSPQMNHSTALQRPPRASCRAARPVGSNQTGCGA